jgi:cbb3-type cytochrome oxidase subunit 3
MMLPILATVLVSFAFVGLCVWALWPANKMRFERDAQIPLLNDDDSSPRQVPPQ